MRGDFGADSFPPHVGIDRVRRDHTDDDVVA